MLLLFYILQVHRHCVYHPFSAAICVSRTTYMEPLLMMILIRVTPSVSPTMTPSQTQNSETSSNPSSTNAIFPLGRGLRSWTTLRSASDALPISDTTFRPTKGNKAHAHDTVTSPEPNSRPAMLAVFSKGCHSHSQTKGGFSFYAPGPQSVDLTTAKEVTFGYSVMFERGFQFNKGGKLPGLCESSFGLYFVVAHNAPRRWRQ